MTQEYSPTLNEDKLIGGIQSFGAQKFTPSITNITGTYILHGHLQRVGRLLFFGVLIEGDDSTYSLASSVLTVPRTPYKRTVDSVANVPVFKGICHQSATSGLYHIMMNDTGGFNLTDETNSTGSTWITGYYWVE